MTEPQHDRDLERYLQGNDPLSRAYGELRGETPPPSLDRAVLAEARKAIGEPGAMLPRWPAYVAIAASIVLSLAVLLRAGDDLDAPASAGSASRLVPEADTTDSNDQTYAAPSTGGHPASQSPVAPVGGGTSALAKRLSSPHPSAGSVTSDSDSPRVEAPSEPPRPEALGQPLAQSSASSVAPGSEKAALPPQDAVPTPDEWLRRIGELRAAGLHEQAAVEMKRLRRAHPGYFERAQRDHRAIAPVATGADGGDDPPTR